MGVYIKDLKKPENCDICPIFLAFTTCGCDRDHCMFQEVPEPHGRLISADELIEFIENRYEITWEDDYEGGIKDACIDVLEKISTMPTVIPASEEGE